MDDDQARMETLRATSDQLIIAIAEADARERRKRGMAPSDPSFIELARGVRTAAEAALELARQEERVALDLSGTPSAVGLRPIDQVSPAKELAGILERWRAVEQRLLAATPGSADAEALMLEFEGLRSQYSEALKARQRGSGGGPAAGG